MQQIPVHRIRSDSDLIAGPQKFHVRLTKGRFQNLRRWVSIPLMLAFFSLLWLQWGDQPMLFFSFPERRIFFFGQQISWHDLPLLAGLMIAAASMLFFMAVAWGRVWCGFACPQSIWTWWFIRLEDLTEGNASRRAKNQHLPLRGGRLIRRVLKHLLWVAFSLFTALTFTGYFIPAATLFEGFIHLNLSLAVWGWLLCMAALTYVNAGLVREKICLHACPYSRFQGVMFDRHTRTVSYDAVRGEPRRQRRTKEDSVAASATGDCIDCTICVQVCPVGIDIRDGLQAACIDCGACIDACDQVMDKIARPRGLIRFASEEELTGRVMTSSAASRSRFRPRLLGYAAISLLAVSAVVYGFSQTRTLLLEIRRDRGTLYTYQDDGSICNHYRMKVEGYHKGLERAVLSAQGMPGLTLYGNREIQLLNNNNGWRAYRICAPSAQSLTTSISVRVDGKLPTGENISLQKATTFLSGRR